MKLKQNILVLAFLLLVPSMGQAVDLFSYVGMPEEPLSVEKPDWVDENSKLQLKYEVNESYKKWLNGKKVTDASGYGFTGTLQANIVNHWVMGFSRNFLNRQTWTNNEITHKLPLFNFSSDNQNTEVFMKAGTDSCRVMIGRLTTDDIFKGNYELHEDIIAALGSEPDIEFNTDGTIDYARIYAERGRWKFSYRHEKSEYKHRIIAAVEDMSLTVNHKRSVSSNEFEATYRLNDKWFPYLRYYRSKDSGKGDDYRDKVATTGAISTALIGRNNSSFKSITQTVGAAYNYKGGWYYADYSRIFADLSGDAFFNMVNIDTLFFFSTRFIDHKVNFKPGWGNMFRLGFKRHHRSIEYGMQYSMAKLQGQTWQFSETTKPGGKETDSSFTDRTLYLHRFDMNLSRPDKYGRWNLGFKMVFPQLKTNDDTTEIISGGGGGGSKPSKKIRGGWQLVLKREFLL